MVARAGEVSGARLAMPAGSSRAPSVAGAHCGIRRTPRVRGSPQQYNSSPGPLDEHVMDLTSASVHADSDALVLQYAGELRPGELRSLVAVEDPLGAVACNSHPG